MAGVSVVYLLLCAKSINDILSSYVQVSCSVESAQERARGAFADSIWLLHSNYRDCNHFGARNAAQIARRLLANGHRFARLLDCRNFAHYLRRNARL